MTPSGRHSQEVAASSLGRAGWLDGGNIGGGAANAFTHDLQLWAAGRWAPMVTHTIRQSLRLSGTVKDVCCHCAELASVAVASSWVPGPWEERLLELAVTCHARASLKVRWRPVLVAACIAQLVKVACVTA